MGSQDQVDRFVDIVINYTELNNPDGAVQAFHCWPAEISPGVTVDQDVIAFLNSHL
jgi:hypothetical protein